MPTGFSTCPDCSAPFEPTDNYCRRCGMYLAALRETAIAPASPAATVRYERERASLPAPVKKAVTAVAIGTALQVGMSLTGRYLARQAAKQAVGAVRARPKRKPAEDAASRDVGGREVAMDEYADAAAVSETVVVRRVWIRRP
ncbi:MAG: hypothetical protein KatS3mg062_0655 [Tepidiforma sp.]|nr:MAG: hypothetical protein KatS3mg062_0655 [Tepidiforma sp.]